MKINFLYFGKISLKLDFFPFSGDQNNIKKNAFERNSKEHFLPQVSGQ